MTIFSVFCIGTGHTKHETNNIMKVLFDDCLDDAKWIQDGLTGPSAITGVGLNKFAQEVYTEIIKKKPLQVNFAGHSRGAVLCHMVAHKLAKDYMRGIKVSMALIDPVEMSMESNLGADRLSEYVDLIQYMAIIMENVNVYDSMVYRYPLTFIKSDRTEDLEKIYYVKMPGTHGSGTQEATHPVGKVCRELIRNFMRRRGTAFKHDKISDIAMCELFAEIHQNNPLVMAYRAKSLGGYSKPKLNRWIYDDQKNATEHQPGAGSLQGFKHRKPYLETARRHNVEYASHRLHLVNPAGPKSYFFNDKHAKFFSRAFPLMWEYIKGSKTIDFDRDVDRMERYPALWNVRYLLFREMGLPEVDMARLGILEQPDLTEVWDERK